MGNFGLASLIAWICPIFWLIWYGSVQLERLNADVFSKARAAVYEKIDKSSGALRLIGILWYSPYAWPVASVTAWLIIASVLL